MHSDGPKGYFNLFSKKGGNFPMKADRGVPPRILNSYPLVRMYFPQMRPFHTDPIQLDPFIRLSVVTYRNEAHA